MTTKTSTLTNSRNFYKPFSYPWAYDAFVASEQMHWLWTEVPMIEDVKDWKNVLTEDERDFLTKVFRFFTQGDIDVSSAYVKTYLPFFPCPEIRMMLSSFAAREAVHIAAYSHLIETIGMPETVYNEFLEYEAMADKHDFFHGLADNEEENIAVKMAAFSAFTEGMQLFSSFVMLLNFTRNGTMRGMGQIIAWSINDETLHTESMIRLFREYLIEEPHLWNDRLKRRIYEIAEKMVELEDRFIDLAFDVNDMSKQNLTPQEVKGYIRYIADRRLTAMGMKAIFAHPHNPLPWVDAMLGVTHTNFFENRVVDYAKGALTGSWGDVWGASRK
ncbi:MAG: ribonucleotide-diphosphate reductase subunit beta [Burkholderiales bacterium]|uniref:ribonucleotide-diphosphate reductase subunit beta n=1 Tax=uncultured Turicimonas sp. TaxID=1918607 RepID=UPI001EC58F3E|nr:ribonucleotide-diphosphate reductase subunit beta [uncultured Turicimonas sp.]MBS4847381.1 ribonucleotide-diphosphate reductase subunit beta [Burkholderiales bacterium]